MDFFLQALRNFGDFKGRARRSEYWYFTLFVMIAGIAAMVIDSLLWETPILYFLVILASIVPSLSVAVRRLHDVGRSGWFYLIALIPLIGAIILLIWFCTDGKSGPNKWGPN
ncbi:MAG: uncharacterized membrane protein YhaH (DUF805 family), partial [Saprospiraceae bacterium]